MAEISSVSSGSSNNPRVLSIYDGFFSGGARILHTDVVRSLDATTSQTHSVLSLHNQVCREFTTQFIEDDTCYKRLSAAGIAVRALDRQSREGVDQPLSSEDIELTRFMINQADIILTLKEQPLSILDFVDIEDRPLFTCLHRSDPEHQGESLERLANAHALGKLTAAICCAQSTQQAYHKATDIPIEKLPIIKNGVNLLKFKPSPSERLSTRKSLAIPEDVPVVLFAARFDEMKNIPLFIESVAEFIKERSDAHFIICGAGMELSNLQLRELVSARLANWSSLSSNFHALGIVSNMQAIYPAADIVALTSSYGEAAPLCLMEGMAAGVIPVTTDVGDSAAIVGNSDLVTPNEAGTIARTWAMAYESREFLQHQILNNRHRLSNERTFDSYSSLIDNTLLNLRDGESKVSDTIA